MSSFTMSNKTYLITGANRGIGRGLVTALLKRDNTTVIATVRDPTQETAKTLTNLPTGKESKVIVLKIDQQKEGDDASAKAIQALQTEHTDLTAIDVVIANAGIAKHYGLATATPISEIRDHLEVNVIAVLALFQATWPLLQNSKASDGPVFVAISTGLGSIAQMEELPMPATAYGASKAALNYVVRKIHFENPGLTSFALNPGWVQTDMGSAGARAFGIEEAPVTLDQSVSGILKQVDGATREKTGGKFESFDGVGYQW